MIELRWRFAIRRPDVELRAPHPFTTQKHNKPFPAATRARPAAVLRCPGRAGPAEAATQRSCSVRVLPYPTLPRHGTAGASHHRCAHGRSREPPPVHTRVRHQVPSRRQPPFFKAAARLTRPQTPLGRCAQFFRPRVAFFLLPGRPCPTLPCPGVRGEPLTYPNQPYHTLAATRLTHPQTPFGRCAYFCSTQGCVFLASRTALPCPARPWGGRRTPTLP